MTSGPFRVALVAAVSIVLAAAATTFGMTPGCP